MEVEDVKAIAGGSSSLEWNPSKSIAERRAAKCGFNAKCLKTALFRTASPLASPAARLTIPAGISPTALLDSPIMLPNIRAPHSPTTGTFPLPPLSHESLMLSSVAAEYGDRGSDVGSLKFVPYENPDSLSGFYGFIDQNADVDNNALESVPTQMDFEFPAELPKADTIDDCAMGLSTNGKVLKNMVMNAKCKDLSIHHSEVASDQKSLLKEPIHGEDVGANHLLEGDLKGSYPSTGVLRASEDGYNWRKYGQKQVKGSEYPRSYYKCTHSNCQVKKKVERSHDGQITEIVYKGTHNHAKPQPNRRASIGSTFSIDETSEMGEDSGTCIKSEGGSVWRNIQLGSKDVKFGSDWRANGMEGTSSASVLLEFSDPLSTAQRKSVGVFESGETPELSSRLGSHDDDDNEDEAAQGSISLEDDADVDESESKRMKTENCLIETNLASRAVREPRVVVQIESEVDILDDGYRWRKYGQKVVKGNPNPRSYYKCTSAGCSVRKHVERASHDIKCVITTYEGKHNHEVPVARNGGQINSSGANAYPAATNAQSTLTLARNMNVSERETHVQDLAPHFVRKPEFGNDQPRPSFLGNFNNDMKFGATPIYQMKFPSLQNTISYASLGLNSNCTFNLQSYPFVVPDFPISLPLELPNAGNLTLAGLDFNVGKPVGPVQSFRSGQQLKENDARFLRPKQEQNDDNLYDACLATVDHGNASSSSSSSSSSIYHRVIGSFSS
ncbi:WRKY transcription factor SUSIBA2-like [Juglans microcarpa x Juglans regia]|uniref:WRKY transcription factor SUSIBA2-like n=1 Tax=Juglans microcarpa x Juglans regia TaxID=2249226 RepID=UPI001B7E3B23|nr:WRKY transcription factor SUSIBA2-like [Juglans microcarpa x Juglans regia]